MPREGLKRRWLVPAAACGAIVAGVVAGIVWWGRRPHEASLVERSRTAYSRGDWREAERHAREQLRKNRDDPDALRLLSRALFRQSHDESAAAISDRLGQATMTAEDYFLVGQACVRSEKVDPAINSWQQAVRLDPSHFESRVALEQVFFRLDRLAEASQQAQIVRARHGSEALGELMRGQICLRQSDSAGAAEAFERALDRPQEWISMVDPDGVRKQLARSLLQTGEAARAREQLRLLTAGARDSESYWLLSRCDLQQSIPSEPAVAAHAASYRTSHPVEPEPAPFVGEARCAGCHADIFRDQHQSRHARTFFRKDQLPQVPFPRETFRDTANPRVSHVFQKSADVVTAQTQVDGRVYQSIVDYAFGSGDRGLTLVCHDPEGRALEGRLSFYPGPIGWDVTSGQSMNRDMPAYAYAGRALSHDDLRHCMDCHNTNSRSIMTATGPESADRAIGCEKCHGPGGNHVKAASTGGFSASRDADLAIARPSLAAGAAIVGLCATCHSPRNKRSEFDPESPDAVRFQGTTLTKSRCFIESDNKLDCVTCHNPHRNAETAPAWYESRCLQCHSPGGGPRKGDSRASPDGPSSCPVEPGGRCIACHMPRRKTTMAHTAFTDHDIRVHRGPEPKAKKGS
jgi:tetratricopeptide (TPR) repeat protein